MKLKIILIMTLILLCIIPQLCLSQIQGMSGVIGRLAKLEQRLNALELSQKKNKPDNKSALNQRDQNETDQNQVAAVAMRVDTLASAFKQFKHDCIDAAKNEKDGQFDNSFSSICQRVSQLEDNMSTIKGNGKDESSVNDLADDLRGLIADLRKVMDENARQKPALQVKYPVTLYGYIKLDASYDSAPINNGNYARWVEPDAKTGNQFTITARQTRLGLNFTAPDGEKIKAGGKLEIDFYGAGDENKNSVMMRHAYADILWQKADFSILAGQTSDVISPLFPSTLNYVVDWWSGNIGYRRPQLRLTKGLKLSQNYRLSFELAAMRSIGGETEGAPGIQGRTALSLPILTDKKMTLGVSGHTGKEENKSKTWSANLDLIFPINGKIALKGEYWKGENLDAYMGGIGQGIKKEGDKYHEISSQGGWVALNIGPLTKWNLNLGASIDDPDDDDLGNAERVENQSLFVNILYSLTQAVDLGLEASHWNTKYKQLENEKGLRLQYAMLLKF